MPSYTYICQTCGMQFEKHLSISADHEHITCPNGHTQTQRVYTAPRVTFKGSGFYVTDNKTKTHSSS
jgi:putative FmdB family regulatory protein